MSFFDKFKSRNSAPPAPPKRTENNSAASGWPDDEFDVEEDGPDGTYESPPCERQPMPVRPPRPVEENVYLERTPNPMIPARQAAPPPRPAKLIPRTNTAEEFYIDPNDRKPPEVFRRDKPGKKFAALKKPPPRGPPPPPHQEEDVYLDPNEGQGERDDLYLEPAAACPPQIPRSGIPRPVNAKDPKRDPPPPLKKPLVPRAQSRSDLATLKAGPPLEVKRGPFPTKLLPPASIAKPPLPNSGKEPKPSPPPPPSGVNGAAALSVKPVPQSGGEESRLHDAEWFAGNCDRKTTEEVLLRVKKDGTFLVRRSLAQNAQQPYTLAVLYSQRVFNIPVRYLDDNHCYALGKEGKKNQELFGSLFEMISHHKNNPILLIDSKSQAKHTTYLMHPARP